MFEYRRICRIYSSVGLKLVVASPRLRNNCCRDLSCFFAWTEGCESAEDHKEEGNFKQGAVAETT